MSRPGPPLLFLWPPCLSLSLNCSLAAGPLYVCGCCLHTHKGRGQADFSVLLRTMDLLMHLRALCFINELHCGCSRQKEVSMRRWESDTLHCSGSTLGGCYTDCWLLFCLDWRLYRWSLSCGLHCAAISWTSLLKRPYLHCSHWALSCLQTGEAALRACTEGPGWTFCCSYHIMTSGQDTEESEECWALSRHKRQVSKTILSSTAAHCPKRQ